MKTIQIGIKKKKNGKPQYLKEVLPSIPTNTILYKKLTGLGATYSEITSERHSIIIEPNVPPITGKCNASIHKGDNLFGVYEGVYTDDVVGYIEKTMREKKWIKILTTPESYRKVKEAFNELDIYMEGMCFLLFDECHKLVKDVDYRSDIILPIDDFFNFEKKALVSATPIMPSDPRFEQHDFQIIEIVPEFDYKGSISLVHTNNVMEALKRVLVEVENQQGEERSICFFINSTDMIYQLIDKLDIADKSMVFCADKSVDKLRFKNFRNASKDWSKDKMKRYNFFTSRFHAALDIELDECPDVIFVSEVYFAEHSMVDPHTDAIQAIGRFRNGVSYAIHIFNTSKNFPIRTREGIQEYIKASKNSYTTLKQFYDCATSTESRRAFKAALDSLPYNKMLTKNKEINYFAIDNYTDEALLKSNYNNLDAVISAYQTDNGLFNIYEHKEVLFPFGEFERLQLERKSTIIKERQKEIIAQLEMLKESYGDELASAYWDDLRRADSFIVDAYEIIGKEVIEQLDYSRKKISEAIILKQHRDVIGGTEFIQLIKNAFCVGRKYSRKYIKDELIRIHGLVKTAPRKAITATTIKEFFEVVECKVKGQLGFLITEPKI